MATPMLNCCSFKQGMYLPNGFDPPTDSCPPIIGYYADILDAPAGMNVGDLAVERYVDGDGNQHIHLYEWDGAVWVERFGTSFRVEDGLITEMSVEVADFFQISVDGGVIWGNQSVSFDPPVATVEVWFKNSVTGCIYTNIPQIPLVNPCFAGVVVYPDFASIPAGTTVGEPAMVAENSGIITRSIYEWDGAVWNLKVELVTVDAPTFTNVFINTQEAGWEYKVGDAAWNVPDFTETNNVPVNFKKTLGDCLYQNDSIVPS